MKFFHFTSVSQGSASSFLKYFHFVSLYSISFQREALFVTTQKIPDIHNVQVKILLIQHEGFYFAYFVRELHRTSCASLNPRNFQRRTQSLSRNLAAKPSVSKYITLVQHNLQLKSNVQFTSIDGIDSLPF